MDIKIYHNPRCSKSRQTLAILEQQGVEAEVIEYLKTPPNQQELDSLLRGLQLEPQALMRRGEAEYKELNIANSDYSRAELIALMVAHPKLIERPIVVVGDQVVIGRPPENVLMILP